MKRIKVFTFYQDFYEMILTGYRYQPCSEWESSITICSLLFFYEACPSTVGGFTDFKSVDFLVINIQNPKQKVLSKWLLFPVCYLMYVKFTS